MKKTQEFKSQQRVAEERSVLLDSAKTVLLCTQEKEPCTWGRLPEDVPDPPAGQHHSIVTAWMCGRV